MLDRDRRERLDLLLGAVAFDGRVQDGERRLMVEVDLLLEVDGPVARLTLNRPEAANGLHIEMAREFMLAAIECDENPAVRAVILTGAGKMFCAGGDLKSFATFGDDIPACWNQIATFGNARATSGEASQHPTHGIGGMASGDLEIGGESAPVIDGGMLSGATPGLIVDQRGVRIARDAED